MLGAHRETIEIKQLRNIDDVRILNIIICKEVKKMHSFSIFIC